MIDTITVSAHVMASVEAYCVGDVTIMGIFSGQSRYQFPAMPFAFVYGSWFLVASTFGTTNHDAQI